MDFRVFLTNFLGQIWYLKGKSFTTKLITYIVYLKKILSVIFFENGNCYISVKSLCNVNKYAII